MVNFNSFCLSTSTLIYERRAIRCHKFSICVSWLWRKKHLLVDETRSCKSLSEAIPIRQKELLRISKTSAFGSFIGQYVNCFIVPVYVIAFSSWLLHNLIVELCEKSNFWRSDLLSMDKQDGDTIHNCVIKRVSILFFFF